MAEREVLTPLQQFNEYIMISLRTMEGVDLGTVNQRWGSAVAEALLERAQAHVLRGTVRLAENIVLTHILLTREGKLLADGIAADLFAEEEIRRS